MKRILNILILLILTGCTLGPEKPDEQDVWSYSNPSSTQLSDSILLSIDNNIALKLYGNISSLVVIKEDQLIFENYYDLPFRGTPKNLGQASMTVLITALDLLIRDGYIQNIQEEIVNFLPEYQSIFDAEPDKELITIEHLLTNKSGISWVQSNAFPDNLNDLNLMKLQNDWTAYVLSRPLEADPGLRYVPNSGAGLVLARVMENALGGVDLLTYLKEELFQKIGIDEVIWEMDPSGTLDGGSGLSLKALDFTKFGYLLLKGGRWKNARVISNEWIFEITKPTIQLDNTISAGYGWWKFNDNIIDLETNDLYFADGGVGQQLYIIPHLQMVVTIHAENYAQGFFNSSTFIFLSVLASLEPNEN